MQGARESVVCSQFMIFVQLVLFLCLCKINFREMNLRLYNSPTHKSSDEKQNHKRHGDNGKDGGDSNELGGFDVVAAVFSGEEAK